MSKSMCGCGCSIISSLMKRLGRTACCSDLFSSHTSEQLHRLATGCPPQPKVTMRQRPLDQTHPYPHDSPIQPAVCLFWLITPCAMQETYGAWQHIAESTACEVQRPCLSALLVWCLRYKNCAARQSSAVIDSLMEPGDLMAVLLPWQQWTCFQLAESFKWMPSDCLWFTVIAAPHQLAKKLFLMEQIKAKQDRVCVWVLLCTCLCMCVWMGVRRCSKTGFCLMAVASRVSSVSLFVMHMTVLTVGRQWLGF